MKWTVEILSLRMLCLNAKSVIKNIFVKMILRINCCCDVRHQNIKESCLDNIYIHVHVGLEQHKINIVK